MSKSKKILSIALALVMVMSIFSICSFAVVTTPTATVNVTASAASVGNNESVTVTVSAVASEDFYAGPMSLPLTYDSTLFTLGTVTVADVFGSGVTEKITNTATAGMVIVTIIPKTDGSPVAPNLNGNETTLATVTFTSASSGTGIGSFAIDNDQKTTTNPTGKFYIGSFDGSDPKTAQLTTMGQTLNRVPVDVTVGAAASPELAVKAAYASSGIIIDTNKTFGGQYAGVVYGFNITGATVNAAFYTDRLEATNGGSLTVVKTPYIARPASYGTGTTVQLKDAGGTVIGTYVIVIFGDLNGNAKIDTVDLGAIYDHIQATATITDEVKIMATNVIETGRTPALKATSLYTIATNDLGAVYDNIQGTASIDQATLAGKHNTYNTYYQ